MEIIKTILLAIAVLLTIFVVFSMANYITVKAINKVDVPPNELMILSITASIVWGTFYYLQ